MRISLQLRRWAGIVGTLMVRLSTNNNSNLRLTGWPKIFAATDGATSWWMKAGTSRIRQQQTPRISSFFLVMMGDSCPSPDVSQLLRTVLDLNHSRITSTTLG